MQSKELIRTILSFVMTIFITLLTYFGHRVSNSIDKMTMSIEELNVKMAVVITSQNYFEKRLQDLEKSKK